MTTIKATVHERGNGLPDVGDYVSGDDGEVYEVTKLVGPIHTGSLGVGNHMHAYVKLACWTDVTDDNEPVCGAVIEVAL
jgi:hypothetical protein